MPTQLDAPFSGKADITLTNADEAYELLIPSRATQVSVFFVTNAGSIGHQGTEGVALAAADKIPIDADRWFVIQFRGGSPLYVESAVGGTVVRVICEQAT